jgi:hypothetical protein
MQFFVREIGKLIRSDIQILVLIMHESSDIIHVFAIERLIFNNGLDTTIKQLRDAANTVKSRKFFIYSSLIMINESQIILHNVLVYDFSHKTNFVS